MTKLAYLQFKAGPDGPFQTVEVPRKESLLPWQKAGLSYTATGYGRRVPSRYMVNWEGKWRRVYVCQFSNAGTAYLGKTGAWLCTVDL